MTAKDLMQAGRLAEARQVLIEEVKANPADAGRRTLLFQVLSQRGEWDKALKHLDMISVQDPNRAAAAHTCQNIVRAEQERLKVLTLAQTPSVLPEAPDYFGVYLKYLNALKDKSFEQAHALITEIDAARPVATGTLNGQTFSGWCDTDARLYAFLEAFVHARYVWIPFEAIRELVINPPQTALDLIWATAAITTWEGLSMNCHLPVVYPESFLEADDLIKMGRLTDWLPLGSGLSRGVGQHVYQTGEAEVALLEIKEVTCMLAEGVG